MAAFRIAVIGGDGIGLEVIDQAIRVAEAARRHDQAILEWNRLPWSSIHYQKTGQMMPPDGWDILRRHDAILLGAIGHPDVPDHITLHGLLLPMRRNRRWPIRRVPASHPRQRSLGRRTPRRFRRDRRRANSSHRGTKLAARSWRST